MTVEFTLTIIYSDDVVRRPACSECRAATLLVGIEQSRRGHELHTFECPICAAFQTEFATTQLH